jgi:hypothetical protein
VRFDDFLDLVWLGAFVLGLMLIAAAIVEAIGERRLADALRLDLGDEDDE